MVSCDRKNPSAPAREGGEENCNRGYLYEELPHSLLSVFVSNFENKHSVVAAIIVISFKADFRLGGQ
jgi:hypothetical protein